MHIFLWILLFLLIMMIGIIVYDSNRFVTVKYQLTSEKVKKDFRFVFLSDLHNKTYGKENKKLLEKIEECRPDAVFIGGDILTAAPGKKVEDAANFILKLADKYKLYYANGNHEQRLELYPETYGDMGSLYEKLLKEYGVCRLVNSSVSDDEFGLQIIGAQIERKYYKRFRKVNMDEVYLSKLLPETESDKMIILMAHNPDYFEQYVSFGADLILSGHVHGGVMRLPKIGGVLSTNFRLFPKYDGGEFRKDKTTMLISRGLGTHTIPLRIFNPAELVVVEVRKENCK